jgi:predicted GNAT family N-acyltransferase
MADSSNSDPITVKLVETKAELESAISVRFRVFVAEQNVPPEEELDEEDAAATHVIALHHGSIVGTGRLLSRDPAVAIIGRMAVDKSWRRQGVGGLILEFLEDEARTQGMRQSVLHAQEYVKSFYAAHGYREHGDPFVEVDIPHIEMRKDL